MVMVTFWRGKEAWTIQAQEGQRVFDLAHQLDAPVETTCNGVGSCIKCKVKISSGALSQPTALERDRLGNIFHITGERMACQSHVTSQDVKLEIPSTRKPRSRFINRKNSK